MFIREWYLQSFIHIIILHLLWIKAAVILILPNLYMRCICREIKNLICYNASVYINKSYIDNLMKYKYEVQFYNRG